MKSGRDQLKQMEEDSIRDIMEQLSFSREEAVAWRQNVVNKNHRDREVIYSFLKRNNPRVQAMEQDAEYQKRFAQVAEEMQVSLATAKAHVITGDILAEGGEKLMRKRKSKSSLADFQEMLGVTVPIPPGVLDALEGENV